MISAELPLEELADRARSVSKLANNSSDQAATERIEGLLGYLWYIELKHSPVTSRYRYGYEAPINKERQNRVAILQKIPFLRMLPKPDEVSVPWFELEETCEFFSPSELMEQKYCSCVFSQVPILDPALIKGEERLLIYLGINKHEPNVEIVLNQICSLINYFDGKDVDTITCNFLEKEAVFQEIYKFLSLHCNKSKELIISTLSNQKCIWQDGRLHSPQQMICNWNGKQLYPYLTVVSDKLSQFEELFILLGVKREATEKFLVDVLAVIEAVLHDEVLPKEILEFIQAISSTLATKMTHKENYDIYLPDENGILRPATLLSCESNLKDQDIWLAKLPIYNKFLEKGSHFIHGSISRDCALKLGAYPMIEAVLKDLEDDNFLAGTPYGQYEDLIDRLNGILKKYPADTSIFREFIQNADDAKATEIVFVLDNNEYQDCRLFNNNENWKKLQRTPALCIFNNRPFTEEDIIGICQLGRGGKGDTADTIGRFGIGFNVAYHVTDCPCFVSFDAQGKPQDFCVFDPLKQYCFNKNTHNKSPGRRWENKDTSLEQFPDQFEPFLVSTFDKMRSMVPSSFGDLSQGFTMFRLPITHWKPVPQPSPYAYLGNYATSTKLKKPLNYLKESRAGDIYILKKLIDELKTSSHNMLLFLNSLKHISMFELKEDSCLHHFTTTSTCSISSQLPTLTNNLNYEMELCHHIASRDPEKTQWLLNKQHGLPISVQSITEHAQERGLEPLGGTAIQVHSSVQGSLFCFLPMSIPSCLPVHFNAHFLVDDSRKHLDHLPHLKNWNNVIAEHILAPSYLELILEARSYVSADNEESIKWYYNLFPDLQSLSNKSEASKLNIEKHFYIQLLNNNDPVLLDARAIAKGEVEWLTPKESQFCVEKQNLHIMNNKKLQDVFISLGMPIVYAPTIIFLSLCRIEGSDYRGFVTPDAVLHHIAGLHVDEECADIIKVNCELLIEFCIQNKKGEQIKKALEGVPLLLTKEKSLDRSGSLYSFKYSALLPHCAERFIDQSLEESVFVGKQLKEADVIVDLPIGFVAKNIQLCNTTEPVELSTDQANLLKLLWQYLSPYLYSPAYITDYFNTKPIIPTMSGKFFPPQLSKCVLISFFDTSESVLSAMKKLGYHTANFLTVDCQPNITNLLCNVSSASDIITCLKLCPPTKLNLSFTPEEATCLVALFSQCNEIPDTVRKLLRNLPLFKTIDNTFIALAKGKKFYILPLKVPSEGILKIQRETKELVLSDPDYLTKRFYTKIISQQEYTSAQPEVAKFYIQHLIPHFDILSDEELIIHLKFIRDHCSFTSWKLDGDWKNVIKLLITTPLISIEGKRFKVSAFYDPRTKFHTIFNQTKLPPKQWCDDLEYWIVFFQHLGLQINVDPQDWLRNATKTADKAAKLKTQKEPPEDIIVESETLQSSLIQLIQSVNSKLTSGEIVLVDQEFTKFLNNASKLAIIYSKPHAVLEAIETITEKRPKPYECFVCFHEAAYLKDANTSCLVRSILPKQFDFLVDMKNGIFREALHIRPLTVKTTVRNLIALSRTLSDDTGVVVANKSIVTSIRMLKELFELHYSYLEKYADDKSICDLLDEPCILLSPDNITLNLIKPSQLVITAARKYDFRPFCYHTPRELLQYSKLLKLIGVQEELKPDQYLKILYNIKEELERANKSLTDDAHYIKVCKSAYQALIVDLRVSKGFSFPKKTKIILPSDSYQLIDSSKLVHNDIPWIASRIKQKLKDLMYTFLLEPPPDDRGQTLPPPCLNVQLLSKVAFDELHDDVEEKYNQCVDQELFNNKKRPDNCKVVEVVLQTLQSHEFTKGLGRLYWHEHNKTPKKDEEFKLQVKKLTELHVTCVREIKTIIVFKDEQMHGTEDTSHLCYLVCKQTMHQEKLQLFIKHLVNQNHTDLEQFFEELAATIKKHLNHILQNQALIKTILQCNPEHIQEELDKKQVLPFDPSDTADKADQDEIGSEAVNIIPFLEKEDMMLICNFNINEIVIYHTLETDGKGAKKPIFRYAKVTSCKQVLDKYPSMDNECIELQLDATKDDTVKASVFQVYKILTTSQYQSLKSKQRLSSFASPVILAALPENKDELNSWLEITFLLNSKNKLCSFSVLSHRVIAHMHYLYVANKKPKLKNLFLPAAKKVLNMVKKMDDGVSDPKLGESIIELVRGLEELSIQDDEIFGAQIPAFDPPLMPMPAGDHDFISSHMVQSPLALRYPMQGGFHRNRQHMHRRPVSPVIAQTQTPPILADLAPAFGLGSSAGRYSQPVSTRFVTIQAETKQPSISLTDAKMWFQQCKADYQAAQSLFSSIRELEEAIEQEDVQNLMELDMENDMGIVDVSDPDITDDSNDEISDIDEDSKEEEEVKSKPQNRPIQLAAISCKFPALVCFLCHDAVEKCIKGIFYAKCGMPTKLVKVPHLMSLYGTIKVSEHCPQELKKAIHHSVLQVNEHCNTSRYPNYQIPPCAPASVYTDLQAREAIIAAGVLLKEVIKFPDLQEIIGELEELPRALLQLGSISDEYGKYWVIS